MNRRTQRENLFKLLFRIEFNNQDDMPEQIALFFQDIEELEDADREEIEGKYNAIVEHLEEIDGIINEISNSWKTSRMAKVDLTIMRLGVYEIKYDDGVPKSVAINEAVEIAKKYASDESKSFINGVLAKVE